jgi:hypothetical protein
MKVNRGWIILTIIVTSIIAMAGVGRGSTPKMAVHPPAVNDIEPGGTFNVNVTITDVSALFNWQFVIDFDPRILRVDNVTEGPFLGSTGENTIFLPPKIDNNQGNVFAGATFQPAPSWPEEGATGSGVLATIVFSVTGRGTTTLEFDKDQPRLGTVVLGQSIEIPSEAIDGSFSNGTPEVLSMTLIVAIVVAVVACSVGAIYFIRRRRT